MPPAWDPSLFWTAGIVAGLFWLVESARRGALDRKHAFQCGLAVVAAGWLGARVVGVTAYHDPELGLMGGRSWFGGLAAGFAAAVITARVLRMSLRSWLDSAAAATSLGYAVGRIGCFINGCDFGTLSSAPWAITYGPGFPAFDRHVAMGWISPDAAGSLPVHPVQLYASIAAAAMFFAIKSAPRNRFGVWLGLYGLLRLALEPLRGDAEPIAGAITQTQIFAVCALAAGVAIVAMASGSRRAVSRPA